MARLCGTAQGLVILVVRGGWISWGQQGIWGSGLYPFPPHHEPPSENPARRWVVQEVAEGLRASGQCGRTPLLHRDAS